MKKFLWSVAILFLQAGCLMAQAEEATGPWSKLIAELEPGIEKREIKEKAHFFGLLIRAGESKRAMAFYETHLADKTEDLAVYLGYWQLMTELGFKQSQYGTLKKLIEKHPDNALVWCAMGEWQARKGEARQAIHYLNEALRLNPDYAPALFWATLCEDEPEKGLQHATRAMLLLDPDSKMAKEMIPMIAKLRQTQAFREEERRKLKQNP